MPTYDYRCEANDRIVEVVHRMNDVVQTWGELCELAGIDPGDTPPDSPVTRLATGGNVLTGKGGDEPPAMPACDLGGCCGGGACGID